MIESDGYDDFGDFDDLYVSTVDCCWEDSVDCCAVQSSRLDRRLPDIRVLDMEWENRQKRFKSTKNLIKKAEEKKSEVIITQM